MLAELRNYSPHLEAWLPVFEHFQEHVRTDPYQLAIETEDEALNYEDLAERIEVFAARLVLRLPDDNRLVAVFLDRDADLPAWLLAIHRVGGAYLPLDTAMPAPRLAQILEDARPALIVGNRARAINLPSTEVPLMIAEEEEKSLPRAPAFPVAPQTLAYLIYTSGSTGKPKGVEIEHGSLTSLMTTMAKKPGLTRGEKMLGLTRISFDLSVPDLFLPFMVGASLSLIDLETASDPDRLANAFDRYSPDLAQGTPSTWRALTEVGWRGLPGLRLLAGGEAMTRDLADALLPCCGELWNIYGPTETTVWSTCCRVQAGNGSIPIGWPMTGVSVFVTDRHLRLVPDGEVGEIVIGGPGVARGYRNRSKLNAERFVHAQGMRVYRTGDLGRFDEDRALFCLGRSDDQVKVRGFRIELGDVEAALSADPAVSWAAARLWTDSAGNAVLTGYVVAKTGIPLRPLELKKALSERISSYMVPDRIVSLPAMPLTPNGKVDRAALPSPFPSAKQVADTALVGGITDRLAAIWCDLLSVDFVTESDDFFGLGGYSLMTVRLTRRIREAFGVKLAIVDLMRFSKLSEMVDRIEQGGDSAEATMLLNDGGERQPLYWIDAGPLMQTMARAMPVGQPVIALNLTDQDELELSIEDLEIESVAARLAQHLTNAAPTGPILLGGWCRWGIVAFELARQLKRAGREVATLVLLDADRPGASDRPIGIKERITHFLKLPRKRLEPLSFSMQVEKAVRRYRPSHYDGKVVLVRPSGSHGDGGWTPLIGKHLSIASAPGDHESMVRRPHVNVVATVIGQALASNPS